MQIGINGYEEGKGKDKESLFNVTYYFNSLGTLRHNKISIYRYLPYFIFLALPF